MISAFFGFLLTSAILFHNVDELAGKLLLPTCAWVFVATSLNLSIYFQNKSKVFDYLLDMPDQCHFSRSEVSWIVVCLVAWPFSFDEQLKHTVRAHSLMTAAFHFIEGKEAKVKARLTRSSERETSHGLAISLKDDPLPKPCRTPDFPAATVYMWVSRKHLMSKFYVCLWRYILCYVALKFSSRFPDFPELATSPPPIISACDSSVGLMESCGRSLGTS